MTIFKIKRQDETNFNIKVKGLQISAKIDAALLVGATVFSNIAYLKHDLGLNSHALYNLERKLINNALWGEKREFLVISDEL